MLRSERRSKKSKRDLKRKETPWHPRGEQLIPGHKVEGHQIKGRGSYNRGREKFDWRDDNTLYPFEGGVMAVLNSSQGTHFQFGHRSVALEGSPSREAYMKTLCQIKEHINDDSRWSKGAEEAQIRRTDRASALKHLEGFGIAALDHDDIETAVDAFIEGDLIKNKEIAEEVAGKIKKLVQSEKPEDRAKAIAAKESLEKFFKEDEGNKQEIFLNALDEYLDAMEQLGTISPEQAEEKRKAARLIVTSFSDDPAHDAQIFADSGIVGEKEMIKSLENKRDATE